MSDPVKQSYSQEQLITAATGYMGEFFGPIPKDEPERTGWYEHYGMLINFTGYLWAGMPGLHTGKSDAPR